MVTATHIIPSGLISDAGVVDTYWAEGGSGIQMPWPVGRSITSASNIAQSTAPRCFQPATLLDSEGEELLPQDTLIEKIEFVALGSRIGGDHPSPTNDPYSSDTYPTLQARYGGDGTDFAGITIEPFPIGVVGEARGRLSFNATSLLITQAGATDGLSPEFFTGPGDIFPIPDSSIYVQQLWIEVSYTLPDPPPEPEPVPQMTGRLVGGRRRFARGGGW